MRSRITLKIVFIVCITIILFTVITFFMVTVVCGRSCYLKKIPLNDFQTSQSPINNKAVLPVLNTLQNRVGLPIRLKIPKINVDAVIEYVGLNATGEMEVAKDPTAVAWFQIGHRPGDVGSAVIAGHYGILKNGEGSIFDNLKKLSKGDQIYIEDDKGATVAFAVRETRSYDANANASNVFTSSDGKSHLNLVTCQDWDKASESYTKRLVVFADKE